MGTLAGLVPSRLTVEDVAIEWLGRRGPHLEPQSLAGYSGVIAKHILPYLGGFRVAHLTLADVEDWLVALESSGVSRDRQRRALKRLRMLLNCAVEWGHAQANVATTAKMPKSKMKEPIRPLSPRQVEAIRANLCSQDRPQDALLVSLMAYAGLGPAEATRLRWGDVRDRTLIVRRTKTNRVDSVNLLGPVASELAQWRLACGRPDAGELIYPRPLAGEWTLSALNNWRRRIFDPAAKPVDAAVTPYTLRHSFASLLIHAGMPVTYVAQQMRHNLEMTMRTYAHVIADLDPTVRIDPSQAIILERQGAQKGQGRVR